MCITNVTHRNGNDRKLRNLQCVSCRDRKQSNRLKVEVINSNYYFSSFINFLFFKKKHLFTLKTLDWLGKDECRKWFWTKSYVPHSAIYTMNWTKFWCHLVLISCCPVARELKGQLFVIHVIFNTADKSCKEQSEVKRKFALIIIIIIWW